MSAKLTVVPTKITAENYDQRVLQYGKLKRKDDWPFLSHDNTNPPTANEHEWANYFANHLGGYPKSFQLFRKNIIRYYNVPEQKPEDFDTTYKPQ